MAEYKPVTYSLPYLFNNSKALGITLYDGRYILQLVKKIGDKWDFDNPIKVFLDIEDIQKLCVAMNTLLNIYLTRIKDPSIIKTKPVYATNIIEIPFNNKDNIEYCTLSIGIVNTESNGKTIEAFALKVKQQSREGTIVTDFYVFQNYGNIGDQLRYLQIADGSPLYTYNIDNLQFIRFYKQCLSILNNGDLIQASVRKIVDTITYNSNKSHRHSNSQQSTTEQVPF